MDEHLVVSVPSEGTSSPRSVVVTVSHDVVDWAPHNGRNFSVEEPFEGDLLEMLGVHIGDSSSDLRSGDSSVQVEDLVSDGLGDIVTSFMLKELVVKLVLGSESFNFVHEVGVLSQNNLRHVEHLRGVDLVTVEVTTEETSVGVRSVDGLVNGQVGKGTQVLMHSVVLSFRGVKVSTSVSVLSVFTHDSLEGKECVVVLIVPTGGFEEDTDVTVGQFIVTHGENGRSEARLVSVSGFNSSRSLVGEATEELFSELNKLLVLNITSTNNNDVRTDVVGSVVFLNHILGDDTDVFSNTENRLTHHVVSVTGVVNRFNSSFHLILLGFKALSVDSFSFGFNLVLIIEGVAEHVSENFDGLRNVVLKDSHSVGGVFAGSVGIKLTTHVFNIEFKLVLASGFSSLEVEMFKEMSNTTSFNAFLSTTTLNEDRNSSKVGGPSLGSNSDAVVQFGEIEGSVVFKSFRDFTERKVSEFGQFLLGKLESLASRDSAVSVLSCKIFVADLSGKASRRNGFDELRHDALDFTKHPNVPCT